MFVSPVAKPKSSLTKSATTTVHRAERAVQQELVSPQTAGNLPTPSWSLSKISIFSSGENGAPAESPRRPTSRAASLIQTKLKVGGAHDPLEKEADHVADQMLNAATARGDSRSLPRISRVQDATVQKASRSQTSTGSKSAKSGAPALVHDVLNKPGQPLDAGTRDYFEPRIGHSLSSVRVHADEHAARSAQSIHAHAYTAGHDIVFGKAQFAPETIEGKRLLAHELTHVVQQARTSDGSEAPTANDVERNLSAPSSDLIQRDSSTPFVRAQDFVNQYRMLLVAKEYDTVARNLYVNFVFQGLDYHYVITVFKDISATDEDNIAALFTESLANNSLLDICAANPRGRTMLNVLYEAMITGDVSEFERKQAKLILDAKSQRMSPDDFLKSTKEDSKSRPTQVFPVRNMRVTPGYDDAPLEAELVAKNTKVRVKYPARIRGTKMFAADFRTLQGDPFSSEGVELPASQIVGIRDYETNGGEVAYVPALALIDYANRVKHSTLGTIAQVSIAAASVGLAGPGFAGEEAAEATVGETAAGAGAKKWASRLATADRVAGYVQVVSFFVNENRQFLIERFGWAGKLLVKASDVAESAVAIYGIGRLAHGGFQIVKDLRSASKACHEQAASMLDLSQEELQTLERIDRETDALIKEIESAKGPEAGSVAGGGPEAPRPVPAGDRAPATSTPKKTAAHEPAPQRPAPHQPSSPHGSGRTSRSAEFEARGPHPFGKKPAANENVVTLPPEGQAAERPLASTGTGDAVPAHIMEPHPALHTDQGAGTARMGSKSRPSKPSGGSPVKPKIKPKAEPAPKPAPKADEPTPAPAKTGGGSGGPGAGSKITHEDAARVKQLDEWVRKGVVRRGEVAKLRERLQSADEQTLEEARAEFDSNREQIESVNEQEPHGWEKQERLPKKENISTGTKSELEDSAWLKNRIKDEKARKEFMDWLKKGHKEGDTGPEIPQGQKVTESHEHYPPGAPQTEAKVREWEQTRSKRKDK
jgi:hypothetical protein